MRTTRAFFAMGFLEQALPVAALAPLLIVSGCATYVAPVAHRTAAANYICASSATETSWPRSESVVLRE